MAFQHYMLNPILNPNRNYDVLLMKKRLIVDVKASLDDCLESPVVEISSIELGIVMRERGFESALNAFVRRVFYEVNQVRYKSDNKEQSPYVGAFMEYFDFDREAPVEPLVFKW